MSMNKDYYALLGVSPDADKATIEEAYERLAREVQPNVDLEPTNAERMRELDEAFDVLDDPARRAEYDATRSTAAGSETPPPAWAAAGEVGAGAGEGVVDVPSTVTEPTAAATTGTSLKKAPDGRLIAGIALLVGGVAALVAGIVVLAITLTDDDSEGFTETASGLQYDDVNVGSGASPTTGQIATIHYTGTLEDGTQFGSSIGQLPFSYTVGSAPIPGLEEGVSTMQMGGRRILVIPPGLAFGDQGAQDVPPGSTVTFDVQLLAVSDPATDAPPGVSGEEIDLESGLKAIDIVEGTGDEAQTGDAVTVHYTGWLASDGTRFDTSLGRDTNTPPQVFPVTIGSQEVIRGWDAGLPGMKEGGKRRLIVPAELAYGQEGAGDGAIPPNAGLVFDIQLVEIAE